MNEELAAADLAVYRSLVAGPATVAECAAATGLPTERVVTGIAQLRARALVRPALADEHRWDAVPPEVAIGALVAPLRAESDRLRRDEQSVRESLAGLCSLYLDARRQAGPSTTEHLTDATAVRGRLTDLAAAVRTSVTALHPTMGSPETLRDGLALDRSLLEKGVRYRLVLPHTARRQRQAVAYLRTLTDQGAEIRTAALLPSRVILVDDEVAVVPSHHEGRECAAVIHDPVVVAFLVRLCAQVWERAQPVTDLDYDEDVLSEIELAILAELELAHSDEAIARRLDISTRTLRRYLTGLCTRFAVTTRFQLGVAATRAGAVPALVD